MYPNLTHNNSYANHTPTTTYSSQISQNRTSLPNINSLKLVNATNTTANYSYPVIPTIEPLNNTNTKKAIVRLIDFNNWVDVEGQIDEASLKGVRGLIGHLKEQLSYKD